MKDALLEVFQQRMDKCQSEAAWAITVYAAANAFVISEKETFTKNLSADSISCALAGLGVVTIIFVLVRKHEYYYFRNDMARLLANEQDAPSYIKEVKTMWCVNSVLWLLAFAVVIGFSFLASFKCL